MRKPIIALLSLALLGGTALAQSNSGLSSQQTHRVFLHLSDETHLELPQLQAMGMHIVSVRPDPSGEARAVVEALVTDELMTALRANGSLRRMPVEEDAPGSGTE